jgi:hypothetical protein
MYPKYILLFLVALLGVMSALHAQTFKNFQVNATFTNATLGEFVKEVERQVPVHFYFDDGTRKFRETRITYNANNVRLTEILVELFHGPDIYHAMDQSGNIFLLEKPVHLPDTSKIQIKAVMPDAEDKEDQDIGAFRERKLYDIGSRSAIGSEFILSGRITTEKTNEPLPGVTVKVEGSNRATSSDNVGAFSFRLPRGNYVLAFSSVGLKPTRRNIRVHGDGMIDIQMQSEITELQEVVIKSDRESHTGSLQVGSSKLNIAAIKIVPASFGEVDVLKSILTLPGVKTVGEAAAGFNVRGGAADQNLILLDGSTIYNPFHFFGFFSSFNPEFIEDVELFKGSVPSSYGGRLSSVLTVSSRPGSTEKFKGSAGIGLLTSRINLEGPIVKGESSFLIGARKTYSDWIFDLLPKSSGFHNSSASFGDVNASISSNVSTNNKVKVSGYYSTDRSNLNTDTTFTYANRNLAAEWQHEFSSQLDVTVNVGADHFDYGNSSKSLPEKSYSLKFAIDQLNFKTTFKYDVATSHSLIFGLSTTYYNLKPGVLKPGSGSALTPIELENEKGLESALFLEDNFEITPSLSLSGGLRYSMFHAIGAKTLNSYIPGSPRNSNTLYETRFIKDGDFYHFYHGLEPRFSTRFKISENMSVKAAYTVMRQYIHMISNSVAISPTDIWKLSDPNIKPQFSEQISIGLFKVFGQYLEGSIEGYSKRIKNYLDFKSGATLVLNPALEQDVLPTRGKAYGVEFMLKKLQGDLNGWLNYTYSRTWLIADDLQYGELINRGKYYPASYDKPHAFNITLNQKLSRRFNFTFNSTYSTGRPVTVPIGVFSYGGSAKTLYSDRNGYRIPDYFRADISLNLEGNHKIHQLTHNSWTFGVYNITGRKNPYSVFFISEGDVIKGYKLSVFGSAIPFVNYNIRF